MNLERLKVFQKVAEMGSFTGAAERLYMTQPSISKHIKALEEYYHTPLFVRTGHGITLTPAGDKLLQYVNEIISLSEQAQTALKDIKEIASETLHIGASMTVGVYFLPGILPVFKEEFPNINVSVNVKNTGKVLEDTLSGSIDLGLVGAMVNNPTLVYLPFCSERLKLIVGANHPWSESPPTDPGDIARQLFLLREKGSGMRQMLEKKLSEYDLNLETVMELSNTEMIIRLVETGMGVSIVSEYAVAREVKLGTIKALDLPFMDIKRYFYMAYNREITPSPALKAFVHFMEKGYDVGCEV
ncbi:MAG: selenium metabolism-associated LysR family transcriptional regulator [Bacillota bacterium]